MEWIHRACIVVPAFDAERTLGDVLDGLRGIVALDALIVVDDGSHDATAAVARDRGCIVVPSHSRASSERMNHGKGAALRTGLEEARRRGFIVALSVDADGQHPAEEARRVMRAASASDALVLGIRDLAGAGAPRANRISNGISNYFISRFAGRPLRDTQCGLRRYPVERTLGLSPQGEGYDFEAEILLRAAWAGIPIVEASDRQTHFRLSHDPWKILGNVLSTVGEHWVRRGITAAGSRGAER